MDEQRLNDKKIDLIIDMDVLKPSTSVQLGIRKLQEEGASIFPRILLPAGEEADYRVISKLLSLLNIGEEELLTDFIIAHDFCSLYRNTIDILFMVTGSVHLLEQLHDHLLHEYNCLHSAGRYATTPPVVVSLHPGVSAFNLPGAVSRLLKIPRVFWVPFGWEIASAFKLRLSVRNDLWGETCILALEGQQIQPFFIEISGITG
ncbi:MAG: hypothetical protein GX364_01255 [Firmicutes bacterium]|jgi:hypothetical protein|nr:hypothetical protein [Bacillota bacterium]